MKPVAVIDHLVLNVTDVEVSARWYANVLGMRHEIVDGRDVLWFGHQKLHLRPLSASQDDWFTGSTPAAGSADLCFSTSATAREIEQHLADCGVEVELGPIQRTGARGAMTSLYCRDPDGSLIEISHYPQQPARIARRSGLE